MRKALLAIASVATGFVASASTITNLVVHSAKMDKNVPVSVVLPDAYDGTARFPSVYVLHGAGGSNRKAEIRSSASWSTATASSRLRRTAV